VAVFQCETHKRSTIYAAPGDEWTNVWHINQTDLAAATVDAVAIVVAEQALYADDVTIYKFHLKEYLNPSAQAITEYVSYGGSRTPTEARLPSWNVARIDWNAPPATRPVRKYLRASLSEDDVIGQALEAAMVTVLDAFATDIAGIGSICTPSGVIVDPGDFRSDTQVAMRQPGWSRRARPGFHRAYVPN